MLERCKVCGISFNTLPKNNQKETKCEKDVRCIKALTNLP
jgi:hypothetical protein